jgi:DNA polymerase III delta subunit
MSLAFDTAFFERYRILLLYGRDAGVSNYFQGEVLHSARVAWGSIQVHHIKEKEFEEFAARALAPSLFQVGRDIVFVEGSFSQKPAVYETWLERNTNTFFVFQAVQLRRSSLLVRWGESTSCVSPIPCYTLEPRQVLQFFLGRVKAEGFILAQDARTLAAETLTLDAIPHVIEKLCLLLGQRKEVSKALLQDCLGIQESSYPPLGQLLASRNFKRLQQVLLAPFFQTEVLMHIRQALKYFERLLEVKGNMASGDTFDAAARKLPYPVFFKEVPLFRKHMESWSSRELFQMMNHITQAELAYKKKQVMEGHRWLSDLLGSSKTA